MRLDLELTEYKDGLSLIFWDSHLGVGDIVMEYRGDKWIHCFYDSEENEAEEPIKDIGLFLADLLQKAREAFETDV